MPTAPKKTSRPDAQTADSRRLVLIFGQEYLVQQRARELVAIRSKSAGEFGTEIIEGTASNASEAVTAITRALEAISTLPFLGGEKVVWLKDANFFGTDRTSEAKDVLDTIGDLTELLKRGLPDTVTFIISAIAVNRVRSFYKTCERLGQVIDLSPPDERSREGQTQLAQFVDTKLHAGKKTFHGDARDRFLSLVSADLRQMDSELEKLFTFVGARKEITRDDINAVTCATRGALVWDLTDALGERDLPKAVAVLDNLLGRGENAIGILFALINKTRQLLLLRHLLDRDIIETPKYYNAPALVALAQRGKEELPAERSFNPLQQHPYALYKNLQHATRYSVAELAAAQSLWLATNQTLVSSSLDEKLAFQQALAKIIGTHRGN